MAKFHINPKTGEPGSCKATQGGCPFGGDEAHYESAGDARKAFELSMAGKVYVVEKQKEDLLEKQRTNPEEFKEGPTGKGLVHEYWIGGFSSSLMPGAAGVAQLQQASFVEGARISFGMKGLFDGPKKWRQFVANHEDKTWSEVNSDDPKADLEKHYSTEELASLTFKGVGRNPELKKSLSGFRISYPTPKHVSQWKTDAPYDEDVINYTDTPEGHQAREQAFELYTKFMQDKPSPRKLETMKSTPSDPYFAENLAGTEEMFVRRLDQRDRDSLGLISE